MSKKVKSATHSCKNDENEDDDGKMDVCILLFGYIMKNLPISPVSNPTAFN